jgi:hypothetical protein
MEIGMPLWLILFFVAGFLLFGVKISGESNQDKYSKLRLFMLIAVVLFAVAGIADFVRWVRSSS